MSTRLISRQRTLATLVGGALVASPFVLAGIAHADPGTIKVHSAGTPFDDRRNEPKQACTFYIAAFGVTAGETYKVTFEPQGGPPAGTATTASDTYKATQNISKNGKKGDGRTRLFNPDPTMPEILDGMYKVTAANVNDPGDKKTKVFRLNCPAGKDTTPPDVTPQPGTGGTPGDVGGADKPKKDKKKDRDDGPRAVGGVDTGGGGNASSTG